jgi:hypothetical protein
VNQLSIQPFINLNFPGGWALNAVPLITANWAATDGDEWTVPLGLGIAKVTTVGTRPLNLGLQYYTNIERPAATAKNQLRLVITLLYPKVPGAR